MSHARTNVAWSPENSSRRDFSTIHHVIPAYSNLMSVLFIVVCCPCQFWLTNVFTVTNLTVCIDNPNILNLGIYVYIFLFARTYAPKLEAARCAAYYVLDLFIHDTLVPDPTWLLVLRISFFLSFAFWVFNQNMFQKSEKKIE